MKKLLFLVVISVVCWTSRTQAIKPPNLIPLPRPQIPVPLPRPQLPVPLPKPQLPVSLPRPQLPVSLPRPQLPVSLPKPQLPVPLPKPQLPVSLPKPQLPVSLPKPQLPVSLPKPQLPVPLPKPQIPVSLPKPQIPVSLPKPRLPVPLPKPQLPVSGSAGSSKTKLFSLFNQKFDRPARTPLLALKSGDSTADDAPLPAKIPKWETAKVTGYDKFLKHAIPKDFLIKIPKQKTAEMYVLKAVEYSEPLLQWMFELVGFKGDNRGLMSWLNQLKNRANPALPKAVAKMEERIKPLKKGDKFYEPFLPGDNDDLKYVALKDTRMVGTKKLTLERVNNQHQLMWADNTYSHSMRYWVEMNEKARTNYHLLKHGKAKDEVLIQMNEFDQVLEFKERDVFAVELGLGENWIREGQTIRIPGYNLDLTLRGPDFSNQRLMYYRVGSTDFGHNFRYWIGKKLDGTDTDAEFYTAQLQWKSSTAINYKISRPGGATNQEFSLLQKGPTATDGFKFVYVMELDAKSAYYRPDFYKVGFSSNLPGRLYRLTHSNHETHILVKRFTVPFGFLVEQMAHKALEASGHHHEVQVGFKEGGTEWFPVSLDEVTKIIQRQISLVNAAMRQGMYETPKGQPHDLVDSKPKYA